MHPAHALTAFYRVDTASSIANHTQKTDATLTLSGRRFRLNYSLSRHRNALTGLQTVPSCYITFRFLLLDVTASCKPMNVSKVSRQLLRRLAFNL